MTRLLVYLSQLLRRPGEHYDGDGGAFPAPARCCHLSELHDVVLVVIEDLLDVLVGGLGSRGLGGRGRAPQTLEEGGAVVHTAVSVRQLNLGESVAAEGKAVIPVVLLLPCSSHEDLSLRFEDDAGTVSGGGDSVGPGVSSFGSGET